MTRCAVCSCATRLASLNVFSGGRGRAGLIRARMAVAGLSPCNALTVENDGTNDDAGEAPEVCAGLWATAKKRRFALAW